jgi:outer membrane protein OmpA-like peptidoglycan-associated protein
MCGKAMTGQIKQGTSEAWISVMPCNEGYDYTVWVVEKQAMVQEVTANAMLDALNKDGHIALYINFDTGKSTVRPDSKSTVDQIIQLLKANASLRVSLEGHTDNVGNPQANKVLSDARAKAVLAGVIDGGIDASRVTAAGFGADRPIADNKDEAGRAKNRRVELVKR